MNEVETLAKVIDLAFGGSIDFVLSQISKLAALTSRVFGGIRQEIQETIKSLEMGDVALSKIFQERRMALNLLEEEQLARQKKREQKGKSS